MRLRRSRDDVAAMSIALDSPALGRHRIVLEDLPLNTQPLTPLVRCACFGRAIVNIRTQSMQRNATFTVPLHTCDFGTKASSALIWIPSAPDALQTELHASCATECHTALELLRDRLSDQLGVDFRLTNFNDVEVRFRLGHLGELRRSFDAPRPSCR